MPARIKHSRPCSQCGKLTMSGRRPNKPVLCTDCGLTKAAQAAREMRDKQGPAWEAFLASRGPQGRPRATE